MLIENVTHYLSRAEKAPNGLRAVGETSTHNLVSAMILKGRKDSYKPFVVVHTQLDKHKTLVDITAALVSSIVRALCYCTLVHLRAFPFQL